MDRRETGSIVHMSTAVADIERAGQDARRLIEMEALRTGATIEIARKRVAAREGIAPSTVDNILRRRVKAVAGWVRDRLRAALIRELQAELMRLEHELSIARLAAESTSDRDVAAAEAALAQAKRLLTGRASPTD